MSIVTELITTGGSQIYDRHEAARENGGLIANGLAPRRDARADRVQRHGTLTAEVRLIRHRSG